MHRFSVCYWRDNGKRVRKERNNELYESRDIMIDLVEFRYKPAMRALMDSPKRRERKRIVRSLSIEAVCAELAMYYCSNVGSNAVLGDRLLRASLTCLEPANQEIPWFPWGAEKCDKSERVIHSKSPRYAKRSEQSDTHRREEPSKRASIVSVIVENARGFNGETMCASERN